MFGQRKNSSDKLIETESALVEAVIQLLARREYSRHELEQRFRSRVADEALLDKVLDRMVADGYQSDLRCAGMILRQRVGQGYGERRVRFDLQNKGIDSTLIEQVLEEEAVDWFDQARELAGRKYAGRPITDMKEKAKRVRHLQGRGFGFDEIRYALEVDED
ncbi:regulatory protein RecX [Marinobacterium lutimaris]|uniref:Regulatory protein RecX n=1 Tax=Marinobacterium lutimaris TaxID=568106 RepID=A0A1H6BE36_9GAMM|nr:regulatory protein RecX [Marinobacterium lutimaris]SEG59028.1 regulatory protein [Marinobacterium lutimaris]